MVFMGAPNRAYSVLPVDLISLWVRDRVGVADPYFRYPALEFDHFRRHLLLEAEPDFFNYDYSYYNQFSMIFIFQSFPCEFA